MQEICTYLVSKSTGSEHFKFYPKMLQKNFHDNHTRVSLTSSLRIRLQEAVFLLFFFLLQNHCQQS